MHSDRTLDAYAVESAKPSTVRHSPGEAFTPSRGGMQAYAPLPRAAATHPARRASSPQVRRLRRAGAECKTIQHTHFV